LSAIGIFGGTFDPIHHGHLRTAWELRHRLGLSEVRFIPCGAPPHRAAPVAGAQLRMRMLVAAIADVPGFCADDRELMRVGPSYTVDTLRELRTEFPTRSLCLLLGMDAFAGLATWSRWEQLLELAHIVVVNRPGAPGPAGTVARLLAERATANAEDLVRKLHGHVHTAGVTRLEISASELRRSMALGLDPRYLVPADVHTIIAETKCYA
jgi:nicotinate-nucleotide adenylyltransferase